MRVLDRETAKTTRGHRRPLVPGQGEAVRGGRPRDEGRGLALLLMVAAAAPARPSPRRRVVTFDTGQKTPIDRRGAHDRQRVRGGVIGGGRDGGPLPACRAGTRTIDVRTAAGARRVLRRGCPPATACLSALRQRGSAARSQQVNGTGEWTPVVLAAPGGRARDRQRQLRPARRRRRRSTSTTSRTRPADQPDTTIGPAPGASITLTRSSRAALPVRRRPRRGDATARARSRPPARPGHAHAAGVRDRRLRRRRQDAGACPPSPSRRRPSSPTATGTACPTRRQCPANANANQADADKDGVGDACEHCRPATSRRRRARRASSRQISGEVFVKLPGRSLLRLRTAASSRSRASPRSRSARPSTPAGELELNSAAKATPPPTSGRSGSRRNRAGMFGSGRSARRRQEDAIATDMGLRHPPGAEARAPGPAKGIVRSLSMVAKGLFRTLGGASTAPRRTRPSTPPTAATAPSPRSARAA